MEPYSQVNQAAMKAPLSCSVPLACDLLALSKSCNGINDKAERKKKKKSKGHKQGGFDRPSSWVTGYMGESHMILCGFLCHRINPKLLVSSALEVVFSMCDCGFVCAGGGAVLIQLRFNG